MSSKNQPYTKHPAILRMEKLWPMCRDLMVGTSRIREKGEEYLPKHPQEEAKDYERRKNGAEVFNGFARAVRGVTNMLFVREVALSDDTPKAIVDDAEDIDLTGQSLTVWSRNAFLDGMVTGLVGILVDYPRVAVPAKTTLADEKAMNLRPYWVAIQAEQIVSWRTSQIGGKTALTQLVLKFCTEVADGDFGVKQSEWYKVFRKPDANAPVVWERWEEVASKENEPRAFMKMDEGVVSNVDRIPFVFCLLGQRLGHGETLPPLIDLAYLNVSHYRVLSDRRHVMHLTCVPILTRTGANQGGEEGEPLMQIGPNVMADLPLGASLTYTEAQGTGIAPTRQELQDIESRMGDMSLAFLSNDKRVAETAEAKRMDRIVQNASLASAAIAFEDGLEEALLIHAQLRKVKVEPSATLNREFEATTLDAQTVGTLSALVSSNQMSLDMMWDMLERGGWLENGFDRELEKARILLGTPTPEPLPTDGFGGTGGSNDSQMGQDGNANDGKPGSNGANPPPSPAGAGAS